jgi:hypothetical protein
MILTDSEGRKYRRVSRNPAVDDKRYVASGVWKCSKSPTGAHRRVAVDGANDEKIRWECSYCHKKWPYDKEAAGMVYRDYDF